MAIPWHRFLKIGLNQLFSGTCFEVRDEFDLSDQKQLVDFVVLRRTDLELPEPDPSRLPDGLQSLQDHNLISYKSMNEAFDRYALNELVGHAVTYSKLQAEKNWRAFSDELGLIAVSTRQPKTEVIARLLQRTELEDVYEIDCAGWNVTCVVINRAPRDNHNWLWELLRGDRSRWKTGKISDILGEINQLLKNMDVVDPEIEEFENQVLESWLQELSPEMRLKGLEPEERLKGLEPEERLKGLEPEERLKGLEPEERLKGLTAKELEQISKLLRKRETGDN